jgi:hypothetical protein
LNWPISKITDDDQEGDAAADAGARAGDALGNGSSVSNALGGSVPGDDGTSA